MTIYFASDHAGFEYKKELIPFVESLGYKTSDSGAHTFNEEDDYPEFISNAAREVAANPEGAKAIVLGGSGQGEAMVANRIKHVRAAVYNGDNLDLIKLSREHNDANVLSLGTRFITLDHAKEAVKIWLETTFSGEERHERRINQIEHYS